jgi:5'-3' exonuclease
MVPLYRAFQDISASTSISSLTDKHKLDILLCFDNKSHPMKAETQANRRSYRQYHLDELNRIYQRGEYDPAIADRVTSHRKQITSPREDLIAMLIAFCKKKGIKYCSGPFEADWQLISLQQQGLIQR